MTTISTFLTGLPPTWKAVSALAGAVGVGVTIGVSIVGFVGVPSRLEKLEITVADNSDWREQHTREFRALVCLLTLPDSASRRDQMTTCGL